MLILTGITIDYTRAIMSRQFIQHHIDSAVLSLISDLMGMEDEEIADKVKQHISNTIAHRQGITIKDVTVSRTANTLHTVVSAKVPTSMLSLAGVDDHDIRVVSAAILGSGRKLEIALVLDNSTSMDEHNRMLALKTAVNELITTIEASAVAGDNVRMAVVPFGQEVRLDNSYKNANWIYYKPGGVKASNWTGCLYDREAPYDTNNGPVQTGQLQATGYWAIWCSSEQLSRIMPLTSDLQAVRQRVDGMLGVGSTNITIGMAWGISALDSTGPLASGEVSTPDNQVDKVLILVTDGHNSEHRHWGFSSDPAIVAEMNTRTLTACTAAKDAGITVYTVRLYEGNASLLSNCASSMDMFFNVNNITQLHNAFSDITARIGNGNDMLRLTH